MYHYLVSYYYRSSTSIGLLVTSFIYKRGVYSAQPRLVCALFLPRAAKRCFMFHFPFLNSTPSPVC